MFRKPVAQRSWLIWIFCAVCAPITQLLAGFDWKSMLAIGLIATCAVCLLLRRMEIPGWLCALELVWLTTALAACAGFTADSWPMGNPSCVVPLTLLALGVWSAGKGPGAAAGTAGILFLLLCIGYGLVLGSGVSQIRWDWARRHPAAEPGLAIFVFLLPAAAAVIPKQAGGKRGLFLFLIPVFSLAATVVTCGSIHPDATYESFPFYEMSRSLSLLGVAERFEALVCAIITVGWFSTVSFLLSAVGAAAQKCFPGTAPKAQLVCAVIAGAAVLGNLHMDSRFLGLGSIIFWGVLPLAAQGIVAIKNSRKKSK